MQSQKIYQVLHSLYPKRDFDIEGMTISAKIISKYHYHISSIVDIYNDDNQKDVAAKIWVAENEIRDVVIQKAMPDCEYVQVYNWHVQNLEPVPYYRVTTLIHITFVNYDNQS